MPRGNNNKEKNKDNVTKHRIKGALPCVSGIREAKMTKTKQENTAGIFTYSFTKIQKNWAVMLEASVDIQWCESWVVLQRLFMKSDFSSFLLFKWINNLLVIGVAINSKSFSLSWLVDLYTLQNKQWHYCLWQDNKMNKTCWRSLSYWVKKKKIHVLIRDKSLPSFHV